MKKHPVTPNTPVLSLAAALGLAASAIAGTAPAPTAGTSAPVDDAGSPLLNAARPCICLGADTGLVSNEDPFSASLAFSYDTTFFCRGMDMGDNVWSAWVTADVRVVENLTWTVTTRYLDVDETDFRELHMYTGLFYRMGIVSFGPSFRWYHNFEGGMMENAYDLGLQTLVNAGPIDITGGYFYETESQGHFFEVGVSSRIPITDRFSLVPAVEIGYTDGWMMPIKGWNHVGLRLAAPVRVIGELTVTPWIGGNLPLEALDGGQDNELVGGVSLSIRM
jgi:hypothetical protein